jgi:hypothetical protein
MTIGPKLFSCPPSWTLGNTPMITSDKLEVLGGIFTPDSKSTLHVNKRIKSARESMFSLSPIGMGYPGLHTDVKVHLWKTTCLPALVYGCEAQDISTSDLKSLNSAQGSLLKNILGIGKRSHHSKLLQALSVKKVDDVINERILSFYYRIFQVNSPLMKLCSYLMSEYVVSGVLYKGTIVENIVRMGHSPIISAFKNVKPTYSGDADGVVESLRYLLYHENYIQQGSNEHILTRLLTRCF